MQEDYNGRRVIIAGKGVSGRGAYEALTARGAKCVYAEDCDNWDDAGAELIIVSPGIACDQPIFEYARARGIELYGELELGYRLNDAPIIAVTGTNGKTTVTRLIGSILDKAGYKTAVCGNVGASFALAAHVGGYDYAVVEASSFQLETVDKFAPHIAVITNIFPDHLNRHGTMLAYAAAKSNIARKQTQADWLVLSADDVELWAIDGMAPVSRVVYTSMRERVSGAYLCGKNIVCGGETVCEVDRVRMEGKHNIANALSAVCVSEILGISNSYVVDALTEFGTDSHRIKLVACGKGKCYYDDSKGTNVMASVRAAECMCGTTCMIVGGSDKGYEYDDLFLKLPECVVRVAAVGETASKVVAAAERQGFSRIERFDDFSEAVAWASEGDEKNVLLSPASASFDAFASYAERGETFERLVKNALAKK